MFDTVIRNAPGGKPSYGLPGVVFDASARQQGLCQDSPKKMVRRIKNVSVSRGQLPVSPSSHRQPVMTSEH